MWKIDADENVDWGFARNKQVLMKTPIAEYSTSALTVQVKLSDRTFYGANRDYSWQGLVIGPLKDISYKALDGIFFHFPNRVLLPKDVLYAVDRCVYNYACDDGGTTSVEFSLKSTAEGAILEAGADRPCWFAISLASPYGDEGDGGDYIVEWAYAQAVVRQPSLPLEIVVEGYDSYEPSNIVLEWRYKLGDGFRRDDHGSIRFVEHFRKNKVPFMLHSPDGHLRIKVPISLNIPSDRAELPIEKDLGLGKGTMAEAIDLRFRTLSTYSIYIDGLWFPEAGAWWFRRPWIRDALEGIRWNIRTYLEIFGWGNRIFSLLDHLLDVLGSSGGLPIIEGATEQWAGDAPPQLLFVAAKMSEISGSREILTKALDVAGRLCESLLGGLPVSGNALDRSILCSPASASWIDSIVNIGQGPWPTRLPQEWRGRELDAFSSKFGLVEVNALCIEALQEVVTAGQRMGKAVPAGVEELLQVLKKGFIRHFKAAEGMPPLTVAPSYGLVDKTIGSPAVVAMTSLRGILYSDQELMGAWEMVAERLLIYRKLTALGGEIRPFGILVRDMERVPYLGDGEYHGATIWPRDTPYLLKLVELVGGDFLGLLINNLDQMVSEGAVGYCGELFSPPTGGNPAPTLESANPVPVKNPAQYWSHWCDPFLEHLSALLLAGNHKAKDT
jgi:hypothetical protein